MGCYSSKISKLKNKKDEEVYYYMFPDPDLGWKNISPQVAYPAIGWKVDFQNERTGNILENINLVHMALNIAQRVVSLADTYGISNNDITKSSTNLLDLLVDDTRGENDFQSIINQALGVPRYNWKLESRNSSFIKLNLDKKLIIEDGEDKITRQHVQKMINPEGKKCVLDVAEVAINIAEQLFRLEKTDADKCHRIPGDPFKWSIMNNYNDIQHSIGDDSRNNLAIALISPGNEAFLMIPEELIMDVASWVQATYLTAPIF